jgi:septal ring factor EnvC (AmiA/AmiB activator)
MMNYKQLISIVLLFWINEHMAFASNETLQTKQQLNQVKQKMGKLEKTINDDIGNRQSLYQKLAETEKKINQHIQTLNATKKAIEKKQQGIHNTTQIISQLNQKLISKQATFSQHLRIRYQIHQIHPLQWFFGQQNPNDLSRFLTYYQYLIHSDEQLIHDVRETKNSLAANQGILKIELAKLKLLEQAALDYQKKLAEAKKQHHGVIQTLDQTIQSKQQILTNYKQDQARLQTLLEQLSRASYSTHSSTLIQPNLPTPTVAQARLNAKFLSPLNGNHQARPMNQGMFFLAQEGAPVTAVLPGKVVFSDWLNGYGLLLIIDHGQGMMSLYAHNESLFKSKGTLVKPGEQIATVGHTGGIRENGLYFELRSRGKVIPPRQWLA